MMRRISISEFLQAFPIPPLHHREPPQSDEFTPWVFWSGSENTAMMIQEKIISCFSSSITKRMGAGGYICQFWAPLGDGPQLSTSGQPFAVGGYLSKEFAMYRQYSSENHKDVISATFLKRLTSVNQLIPSEEVDTRLHVSVTVPISLGGFSSPTTCIGVLECTADPANLVAHVVLDVIVNLKEAGLDVFPVEDLIPFETVNGLEFVKDEIDDALMVVCNSHDLALAQVWIACEDKSQVLKLSGFVFDERYTILDALCDIFPSIPARSTLEDYTSRFVPEASSDLLIGLDGTFLPESRAATICLKSSDTGDFDYVFEFIWTKGLKFHVSLVDVLSTLKDCLPRFKFATGEQIGEELWIMFVGKPTSKSAPSRMLRLFPRKRSSENEENLLYGRKIRKANDSSSINITDMYNLVIPKTATLEADYGYGIIQLHLPIWQATYANVEREISKKLGGAYDRLEYLDEDEDWICVETEEEMVNCIKSSRIRAFVEDETGDSLRIQLRVTLSHKWLIGPFGILSINK